MYPISLCHTGTQQVVSKQLDDPDVGTEQHRIRSDPFDH